MTHEPSIPPSETRHREEGSGLSSSRSEFAASLTRRLESVLGALAALDQQPSSGGRRDNFLRRVHALGASAKVLGFAAASEVLTRAEHQIRTSQPETLADDILAVRKQLRDLPTLVLRGPYSVTPPSRGAGLASKSPNALIAEPLAIVVWGSESLIESVKSLDKSATTLELSVVTAPDKLRDACVSIGPDVLLLDAQQGSITLLVDELAQAPELGDAAIIVANVPDEASQGLLELGVRAVLPSSFTAQQLSRALLQARHAPTERTPSPTPFGDITLKDLAERLAQEIRQGLVDCTAPSSHLERIALGDGTVIRAALWSSLARIRDHVIEATEGRIKFSAGPEGAELLAPRRHSRSGQHDESIEAVDLTGRRILVVDDDPAVAWFVGGTLRAAGAVVTEVHDGAEALTLAYRTWPEIIVSDVMMPGLDGFALCHAVKRDVLLRDVPIILLSWKEDLLFRMRDLGADADAYLRKEASGSTIVRRVKELLVPRVALERRLSRNEETRGRLDGTTMRLLLELVANVGRPLRIAVRDAEALCDVRVRHGSLAAATRTLHSGSTESGSAVIGAILGITAGRFSVAPDREPCEPMFSGSLCEVLQPSALRARAAQRVLSGLTLGLIEHLTIDAAAFGSDLPLLPLSLRPIADELLRGTAPRQLLASGVASVQLLESLLSDVARRGAVRRIADVEGNDLLEREMQLLDAAPSLPPPKPAQAPQFSFQLTPSPAPTSPTPTAALITTTIAQARPTLTMPSDQVSRTDAASQHACTSSAFGESHPEHQPLSIETRQPAEHSFEGEKPVSMNAPPRSILPGFANATRSNKPPPNDDVDWALELTWDSTPPPPQPQGGSHHSDIPISKPATSGGGFMRPAIATLERGLLQETPDLANAVVKAMSEVTPAPFSPVGKSTIDEPLAPLDSVRALPVNDGTAVIEQTSAPAIVDTARLSSQIPLFDANRSSANLNSYARPQHGSDNSPPSPVELEREHAFGTPSATPGAATTAVPSSLCVSSEMSDQERSPCTPLATPTQEPHVHQTRGPQLPATTVAPDQHAFLVTSGGHHKAELQMPDRGALDDAVRQQAPPTLLQPFALTPTTAKAAEIVGALPVVHQPPRPSDSKSESTDAKGHPDRDPEDPVFPLISAASSSVDIQPSIDVLSGNHQSAQALETRGETLPHPVPDRDTLRSPGDTDPEPISSIHASSPNTVLEPRQRSDRPPSKAPSNSEALPEATQDLSFNGTSATAAHLQVSARPSTTSKSARATLQPRPVGWIQALGLAALAGMVTFAATVPVASWVRKRQHPVVSEPPIVQQAIPTIVHSTDVEQSSFNAGNAAQTPSKDQDSLAPNGKSASLSSATPPAASVAASATVQDGPAPPDVSLAPGQALIEVTTGGGHAIFVDDAFVGRGPIRVITVAAGKHTLRTRLNGVERNDPVEVTPGHLLRVSLEQAWK